MALKYSFKLFFLKQLYQFMIKTPPQSSNSVSCREKYSEALRLLILKGLCVVVALSSCTQAYFLRWMRLRCRFKSRPGYLYIFFPFFFSFIVLLLFGLLPFILIADPFQLRGIFAMRYFGPLQRMSRITKHVSKARKVDSGVRVTLSVKFACSPEPTLTDSLG